MESRVHAERSKAPGPDDLSDPRGPLSVSAALHTVAIIENSEVFSSEVKTSARETHEAYERIHQSFQMLEDGVWKGETPSIAGFRKVIRTWWRDNARHCHAKDYAAVRPGPSVPPPAPFAVDRTDGSVAVVTPRIVQPEQTVSTPIAAAFDASPPSSAFLWTGAGVTIALLVGLVVFRKRRV